MNKVTIIINDKMGGVPNVFINIADYLYDNGIEVSFLLLHQLEDKQEGVSSQLDEKTIPWKKIIYSQYDNKIFLYRKIAKAFTKSEVLIVNDFREMETYHLHGFTNPLIYVIHGNDQIEYDKAVRFSPIIDRYVCVSEYIKQQVLKVLPERAEDVHYIPQPIPDPLGVRKSNKGDALRLVYIGRYTFLKGEEELVKIAHALQEKNVDVEYSFISNGVREKEFRSRLPQEIKSKFLSNISNQSVYDVLLESDILLFPSHAEGFPLVVAEAMKCGVVPLVSDLETGIPEIVWEGETGFKMKIGEAQGYIDRIIYLNEHREIMKEVAERALMQVADKFAPPQRAADYAKVCLSAVQRPGKKDKKTIPTSLTGMDRVYFPNLLVRTFRKFKMQKK